MVVMFLLGSRVQALTALDIAQVKELDDLCEAIYEHLGLTIDEGLNEKQVQWRRRLRPHR